MVSGDHLETCKAFACDAGIISKEDYNSVLANENIAMEASKLREECGGLSLVQNDDGTESYVI